jgi:hypothetical protein
MPIAARQVVFVANGRWSADLGLSAEEQFDIGELQRQLRGMG